MLTAAGSGYSRWRGLAVTRWREDATCDDWGSYVFLRDVRSGDVWSAGFQPAGAEPDAYDVAVQRGSRRDHPARRNSDDNVGGARFGRGRRRGAPRLDREFRQPGARDRRDVLCRTGAGAAGRRRRASGLHEAVRRHRISRRTGHPAGDATATRTGGTGDLGGASGHRGRRDGGKAGGGDRPGPLPRPRPQHPSADRSDRRPAVVQHGRHRPRSDLRPAPPCARRTRRHRPHRLLDGGCRIPRGGARPRRQASRRHGIRAGGHAGVDQGAGAASSSWHRCQAKQDCSSVSPATC